MTFSAINPVEIQTTQEPTKGGQPKSMTSKSMEFGDFLGGVQAMNPLVTESTRQATNNVNAATVLNAAFTSFPSSAAAFSGTAPSWSYAGGMPAFTGGGRAQQSGMPNLGSDYPQGGLAGGGQGQAVPGTNMSQFELMETMNANNLRLIELQALMQSNMQVWNTKSNILSADHRAKMAMIEKFTARG